MYQDYLEIDQEVCLTVALVCNYYSKKHDYIHTLITHRTDTIVIILQPTVQSYLVFNGQLNERFPTLENTKKTSITSS